MTAPETDQEINIRPERIEYLATHPYAEAFEKLLVERSLFENDDDFENFYSCLVMDMDLAWAAARAAFGDAATPGIAWKMHMKMTKEMRAMWKWKQKKEKKEKKQKQDELEKQAALDKESKD